MEYGILTLEQGYNALGLTRADPPDEDKDAEVQALIDAITSMIENYLGVLLLKRNIADEKHSIVYPQTRLLSAGFKPVNSITAISFLIRGEYVLQKPVGFEIAPKEGGIRLDCGFLPVGYGTIKLSYNAGVYDDLAGVPALLKSTAQKLLAWYYSSGASNLKSETMGSYSYTSGDLKKGLPVQIISVLDTIKL
jgi:hypothetical protein